MATPLEVMGSLREKSRQLLKANEYGKAVMTLRLRAKFVDRYYGPASYEAANARLELCIAVRDSGDSARAASLAEEALAVYRPLLEADPENPRLQAEARLLSGLLGL